MTTNATSITSRCWKLSREMREEADRWISNPQRRSELLHGAGALAFAGRDAVKNPESALFVLEANTAFLIQALNERILAPTDADAAESDEWYESQFATIIANYSSIPETRVDRLRRAAQRAWVFIVGEDADR